MAPLKLHTNKVNSYWKWPSGKLDLKSSSIVISPHLFVGLGVFPCPTAISPGQNSLQDWTDYDS